MIRRALISLAFVLAAGSAQAEWHEAKSHHFVVYSDDDPERLRSYTQRLETFDKAIRLLHATPEDNRGAASRVTVFVLPSVADIGRLHRGAAGFWVPRITPVAFMPRTSTGSDGGMTPQVIMFHEYTHHWMLTNLSDAALPAWYVEGSAELHATALFRGDGSVTFGAAPRYRRYTVAQSYLPASELLRAVPGKLGPLKTDALYSRGWLLTHYLTFDPERRKLLADYLVAINSGKTPEQAMGILGNPGQLDIKIDNYLRRGSGPSITIPANELTTSPVTIRKLSPGEAAAMPVAIRSAAGVSRATASEVVTQARQVAASWPNDAAVQNALAEAEYDNATSVPEAQAEAGYARAEAAADRALAADPKSVHAMLYKGMVKEARARAAKASDKATWDEVRRWYIAANRAEPENAEPLVRFYESFLTAKQTPTKSAETGMLYAYALAPHAADARYLAGRVLLRAGKTKDARIAIAPIAYRAETGDDNPALKVLTVLDEKGPEAALAEYDRLAAEAEKKMDEARNKPDARS